MSKCDIDNLPIKTICNAVFFAYDKTINNMFCPHYVENAISIIDINF